MHEVELSHLHLLDSCMHSSSRHAWRASINEAPQGARCTSA